jgi:hypothetical protein
MSARRSASAVGIAVAVGFLGCSAAYYGTLEQLGIEKRDILVDRVGDAKDAQEDAKEQFATALERFRAVVDFDGGDLEAAYDELSDEFEGSQERAQAVRDRVDAVESVARDLFTEWRAELGEYSDAELRRRSEAALRDTERRYRRLSQLMERSVASMDPVLTTMNDQVLYLKHNLNARAIGSLDATARELQGDVAKLVADMEAAIAEASAFIDAMDAG